jgi:formate dehydrogenase major subunit
VHDGKNGGRGWPVLRQLVRGDIQGFGQPAFSKRSVELKPRTTTADKVTRSICPYCAVGCGQLVFTNDGKITNVEGDPDSPISEGCLCPKGAATFQLVTGSHRVHQVLYRAPKAKEWTPMPLERAMDMVADRLKETRERTWKSTNEEGKRLNHTLGFAHLGGATLDNEENYLIKKLFTALGAVQIENQARI